MYNQGNSVPEVEAAEADVVEAADAAEAKDNVAVGDLDLRREAKEIGVVTKEPGNLKLILGSQGIITNERSPKCPPKEGLSIRWGHRRRRTCIRRRGSTHWWRTPG